MTTAQHRLPTAAWVIGGLLLLALSMAISLMLGAFAISPADIGTWISSLWSDASEGTTDRVLSSIRLPRVLGAALVGAALGAVGAVLQGVYRTPLADSHLLGYSSAAGVGAALGFAVTPIGSFPAIPVAFAAIAAALFGIGTGALRSRTGRDRFILAGVAFGFAMLAWTGLFVLIVDSPRVPTLNFFVFGTLSGTTWKVLVAAALVIAPSLIILWWYGRGLDLLSLGDREATHLGFNTKHLVPAIVAAAGLAIGAAVVLAGVVGFVGLLLPFLLRPLVGPSYRTLIPASALGGAIAVVVADTLARPLPRQPRFPSG